MIVNKKCVGIDDIKRGFICKSKKITKCLILFFLVLCLFSCSKKNVPEETIVDETTITDDVIVNDDEENTIVPDDTIPKEYEIEAVEDGYIVSYASDNYYRYGPSIMTYEDGSMDAWFSAPGNSGSQWDWITYRHSDNGVDWSSEEIVLKPTPGSKDQCSVCDPGVIYFGGYYYLAYTATDYYEGKGTYNMAFVARSKYPDGPFEKWNGTGWGGNPEPIIFYDGGKDNWGIGEVSFVIDEEDLFIYFSYIDIRDTYIGLCKADMTDDWPATIRFKGPVLYQLNHDSVEVVYDSNLKTYLAFTVDGRLLEGSKLVVYSSANGKDFQEIASSEEILEDYSHNLGIAKDEKGRIDTSNPLLLGYAYGKDWGRWNTKFQYFTLK